MEAFQQIITSVGKEDNRQKDRPHPREKHGKKLVQAPANGSDNSISSTSVTDITTVITHKLGNTVYIQKSLQLSQL